MIRWVPTMNLGFLERLNAENPGTFADRMAAVSDDGYTLVLRTENSNAQPLRFDVSIGGSRWAGPGVSCTAVTLTGAALEGTNDFNSPNNTVPAAISASCMGGSVHAMLPPLSFTVVTHVYSFLRQ